jgi:hypothetical protein
LDPSPRSLNEAVHALDTQTVASRFHVEHLNGLFYLFNLRVKYSELLESSGDQVTTVERARQGADACTQMMSKVGVQLDGTPQSLKQLREVVRDMVANVSGEEQRKQPIFLCGSYFGEVVRDELAGGRWNFSADTMLSWTLDWEIGELELRLWPFQRVKEYAFGETNETLFALWKKTEKAYVDLGLASR